jgi:hypothetical protein
MLWFEEVIELNDDISSQLKNVRLIADICYVIPILMFVAGGILFFVSLAMFAKNYYDNKNVSNFSSGVYCKKWYL